jgi:hypothetical protein
MTWLDIGMVVFVGLVFLVGIVGFIKVAIIDEKKDSKK